MFESYIDLLNAVASDGELIQPSDVSLNRSFATKELNNVQLKIDKFKPLLIDGDEVRYYDKELQWYFDSYEKPKHAPIELNHEKWDKKPVIKPDTFLAELRKIAADVIGCCNRCGPNSNYGEMCLRLKNHIGITQLEWCVEKLKNDKSSRQAVAFYNTPNYQFWSNDDFVCCLTQMFSIKGTKLNTVINSRSNDLINSFRFDSIWWHIFQRIVLKELQSAYPELQLGYMLVNIFSAHYYLKDEKKLDLIKMCADNDAFMTFVVEKYL